MEDIKILEDMRDKIYGAMQFEDDYQVSDLEEKQFHALNSAIKALKEREADKERIKELEEESERAKKMCSQVISDFINKDTVPKSLVKEALKDIYDYFDRLNGPDEDLEFIEEKKKELLEEDKNK